MNKKWCIESAKIEASKFKTRFEFQKESNSCYGYCHRNNILDIICEHMEIRKQKWCVESAKIVALKYTSRSTFQKENYGCYKYCKKNKLLDIVCSHMIQKQQKWTHDLAKIEALKYKSRNTFNKYSHGCYMYCVKHNILDDVCSHIIEKQQKWSHDLAKDIALKYTSRTTFQKENYGCYRYCVRHNILDDVCSHMVVKRFTWSYDLAKIEALKYNNRTEFYKNNNACYTYCTRRKILDDVCSHMVQLGNHNLRFIYVFEFNNDKEKSVYVGLSYNPKIRYNSHISEEKSPVYKHIKKTNDNFIFKIITEKAINCVDAQILEHETIQEYKNNGWNILNKGKTGKGSSSLGGIPKKWTKDMIIYEASNYKTKTDFRKKCNSAYYAAHKNGWLDEICSHMIETRKPNGYWNDKNNCYNESLNYPNKSQFQINCKSGYESSRKNGWLDEFYPKNKHKNLL